MTSTLAEAVFSLKSEFRTEELDGFEIWKTFLSSEALKTAK